MRSTALTALAAMALSLAAPAVRIEPVVSRTKADPRKRYKDRSRYMPHQGAREIARRLRQAERARK